MWRRWAMPSWSEVRRRPARQIAPSRGVRTNASIACWPSDERVRIGTDHSDQLLRAWMSLEGRASGEAERESVRGESPCAGGARRGSGERGEVVERSAAGAMAGAAM